MSAGDRLPLYHRLLGDAARLLPPVIARMHAAAPLVLAHGSGTVTRGDNWITRKLAGLLGMPGAGKDRPLRVTFEARPDGESLSRAYPDATLITLQRAAGPPGSGLLAEEFGPFSLRLRLDASRGGIDFALIGTRWHGIPLPRSLCPRLQASERADGDDYRFHVRIDLPLLGRLIEYEGTLRIAEADAAPTPASRGQAEATGPLVLFDGACNLCNGSVRFLAARDRTGRLRFAPIQSESGQAVLRRHNLPLDDWDSFVFLEDGRIHLKAEAILRMARFMRWPWPLLRLFTALPRRPADWLYDRVARNRYALFGRARPCSIPGPSDPARLP